MWLAQQILRATAAKHSNFTLKPPAGVASFNFDDLLKRAAELTHGGNSRAATISRLRRKFRKNKTALIETVQFARDDEEIRELDAIERAKPHLELLGIKIELKGIRGRK